MLVYIFSLLSPRFYWWQVYIVLVNLEIETQQFFDVSTERISIPCFFSSSNLPQKINQSATFAVSYQNWKEIIW